MKTCIVKFERDEDDPLLDRLVMVLSKISDSVFLVANNYAGTIRAADIWRKRSVHRTHKSRNRTYLRKQLEISLALLKNRRQFDTAVFYTGAAPLVLAALMLKLLRKRVIVIYTGSSYKSAVYLAPMYGSKILLLLELGTLLLAEKIVAYSESCVKEFRLERYRSKTVIGHEHFVDLSRFNIRTNIAERRETVGFIGRLTEEKGIWNFVNSIQELLRRRNNLRFVVIGDGRLREPVRAFLAKKGILDRVTLTGWIPNNELPAHYNDIKLAVIPSFTEGLPNVMLEAMACGTPVLVTSVGAIPDLIEDGETGFILEDNSIASIITRVGNLLDHPECLINPSRNGNALVGNRFSFQQTVEEWRDIISNK